MVAAAKGCIEKTSLHTEKGCGDYHFGDRRNL